MALHNFRFDRKFYVYIVASISRVIYIGVTNNIVNRVWQHKTGEVNSFTQKYKCCKLVYCECYKYIDNAILREKQLKRWNRQKKEFLINKNNLHWNDLSIGWYK